MNQVAAPSKLSALPKTRLGKVSGVLLIIVILLIILNSAVVQPITEPRPGAQGIQQIYNLSVFVLLVVTGLVSVLAIIMKRERSWVLFLAVVLLVVVLGFEIPEIITGRT